MKLFIITVTLALVGILMLNNLAKCIGSGGE